MRVRSTFARVRGDCAAAARPLGWLAIGVLASTVYLYAAMLVRVEGRFTLPAPLFPPQAVILAVLLLTSPRQWWLLLGAYYVMRVGSGLFSGIDATFTLVANIA